LIDIDCGKPRSASDALYTAGVGNGLARVHAKAIELLIRLDHDALGPVKSIRFRPINQREILAYALSRPDYLQAVNRVFGAYPDAVRVIGSRPAAAAFAWLITRSYDEQVVDRFMRALGSGAMLSEDDPVLALRAALTIPAEDGTKMPVRTRLALLTKAFMMVVNDQRMTRGRGGKIVSLAIAHNERFTKVEPVVTEAA
jgi:hypothetical protein